MALKTSILLTLCVTAIISVFFVSYRSLIISNYRSSAYENTYTNLYQVASTLQQTLDRINLQAEEVLADRNTASILVTEAGGSDASNIFSISTLMEIYADKNSLIKNVWLYTELTESILSPQNGYLPLNDDASFPRMALDSDILDRAMDSDKLALFYKNGYYYLVTTYPAHTALGVMVTAIDPTNLYRQMSDVLRGFGAQTVYLFDDNHASVFGSLVNTPSEDQLLITNLCYEKESLQIYNTPNAKNMIACYTIPDTGWQLLQIIPVQQIMPSRSVLLLRILPLILLALLVILLMTIYLIRTTYEPLARVVDKLIQTDDSSSDQNTIDTTAAIAFIESNLQNSYQENLRITSLLSSVAPALQGKLFQNLLEGIIPDPESIQRQLKSLDSPFTMNGLYQVLAVEATCTDEDTDEIHRNIFTLSLRSYIDSYWSDRCCALHIYETPESCLLAVLMYDEGTTQAQIGLAYSCFKDYLKNVTQGFAFYPETGISSSITNILELHRASEEAKEQLRYNRYTRQESSNPISSILERLPQNDVLHPNKVLSDQERYIEDAKAFIVSHYSDCNLSQEMICRHIGISVPYFSALFTEHENQNFLNYLHQYRIEQARKMLIETDDTIADIGFHAGFSSSNSFIRVFKKLMNETPGKYRDRIRQEQQKAAASK